MRAVPPQLFPGKAPLARFALPVSRVAVALRQLAGTEDVLLTEARVSDPSLTLALAERLAWTEATSDWADFSVTDIDVLIVRLRQAVIGDRVIADVRCNGPSCGRRVDLSFGLGAYLDHHRPKPARARGRGWSTEPCQDEAGWYALRDDNKGVTRFRLPTLGDQIVVEGLRDTASVLAARCIRSEDLSAQIVARTEAAMRALAPALSGPIKGRCPDCAAPINAYFSARLYCLQELSDRAHFIYDDIDALAERYHWSEGAILRLPNDRRTRYADRVRQARLQ
jgi:hypothetical protein